jgi:N6-adenosine-specific RNA methylase IME4
VSEPFVAVLDPNWNTDDGGGGRGAQNHYETASVAAIVARIRMAPGWKDTGDALVWMWATTLAVLEGDAHGVANGLHLRPCSGWVWAKVEPVTRVRLRRDPLEVACPRCRAPAMRAESPWGTARELARCHDGPAGLPLYVSEPHQERVELALRDQDEADVADADLFIPTRIPGLGFWQRCEHEHLWLCRRGDVALPPKGTQERSVIYAPRLPEHSAKPDAAWRVIERTTQLSTGMDRGGVEYFCRGRRAGWSGYGRLDGEQSPLRFEAAEPSERWAGGT